MTRPQSITTAAAITLVAAAVLSSPAPGRAASVWLWACHGPGGEPLGATPFQPAKGGDELAVGDGLAQEYGGGCGQAGAGGLQATFSQPDPEGGSEAAWQLRIPEGVTLESVRIARTLSGFGGAPIEGDPLFYEAGTSSEAIELASLESRDAAFGEVLEAPAKGRYLRVSVGCGLASAQDCAAPANGETVGVKMSAIALGVRGDAPPSTPGVRGVESPDEDGTLPLALSASDTGVGLASAEASLEGGPSKFARLGSGACPEHPSAGEAVNLPLDSSDCPKEVSEVPLPLDTTGLADGEYTLRVSVTDAAGNTSTREWPIVVRSSVSPTGAIAIGTIAIGSAGAGPAAGVVSGFSSSTPGGTPVACQLPHLSMKLVSKPLRWAKVGRRRVPVLLARRHYVFRGHLTCLLDNRRVSAPTGIVLRVLYTVKVGHRYRTYASGRGTMTVHNGNLRAILAYWSSRTIIFRYAPGNGEFAQVKIPVEVVRAQPRARRGR